MFSIRFTKLLIKAMADVIEDNVSLRKPAIHPALLAIKKHCAPRLDVYKDKFDQMCSQMGVM
jgi:hypothetical protein